MVSKDAKLTVLVIDYVIAVYTLCLKKVPTFKLSVTLSNFDRFSKFLQHT